MNDKLFIWALRAKDILGNGKLRTYTSWDGPPSNSYNKYILYTEYENQLKIIRNEYNDSVKALDEIIERLKKELKDE